MKCGIVRGLWGDVLHKRHETRPPKAYYSILEEVKRSATAHETTDRVYCWGEQNYDYCKWLGLPAVQLGHQPYGIPRRKSVRGPLYGGQVVWGLNHFYHKWIALEQALQEFDAVVWVDWDMRQVRPIPATFWVEQTTEAPLRSSLILQKNSSWGARWRHKTEPNVNRIVPYGGCVYFNNLDFVRACRWQHDRHRLYMQQQILAECADQHNGGWIGAAAWRARGFCFDLISVGNLLQEPPEDKIIWRVRRRLR